MIHVIASIRIKPGTRADFLKIIKKYVPEVLAEAGCLEYTPAIDFGIGVDRQVKDENVVTVVEKWESLAALHAHFEAAHMKAFKEEAGNLIDEVCLTAVSPV